MPHIASTLTCDNLYSNYGRGGDGNPIVESQVLVRGGYGIANDKLVTPTGAVLTDVTSEQLDGLQKNGVFRDHVKNGFIQVLSKKAEGDKVADGMKLGDKSQPLTPAHFAEKSADKPDGISVNSGKVK